MNRKKIFSILGLIAVIVITMVAYFTPEANAENGQTTITVNVTNPKNPTVEIANPSEGADILPSELSIAVDYTESDSLSIQLSKDEDLIVWPVDLEEADGTYAISNPDLSTITNVFGEYTLAVVASGDDRTADASLTFALTPLRITKNGHTTDGNPVVHFKLDDSVKSLSISIPDPNGDEMLFEATINPAEDLDENGNLVLPFVDLGLTDGEYYPVSATALDANGQELGTRGVECNYRENSGPDDPDDPDNPNKPVNPSDEPAAPAVPDTGSFAGSLNVSKTDYIIAIVAGLGITVVLAIFYTKKRSKRQ